jgi:hypothetical protein
METVQTDQAGSSDTPVKFGKLSKCEHVGCICTIATGERFCSDYCAEQATSGRAAAGDDCDCGHAECVHVVSAPSAAKGFVTT